MEKEAKQRIFNRLFNSVPRFVWIICASYMTIVLSTVVALLIARVDADDHINRYMEILLKREEAKNMCNQPQIGIKTIEERLQHLESLAHKKGG